LKPPPCSASQEPSKPPLPYYGAPGPGTSVWLLVLGALAVGLAWTGPSLDRLGTALLAYSGWTLVLLFLVARHGGSLDRMWVLLGGAVLLRLLFLPTVPDLSVDPFRYVWDGWLSAGGVNPYRHTPSDPVLVHGHGEILFREMNSRDFFSIYPPLSQWLFLPAGLAYERWGWPGAFFVLKGTLALAEFTGLIFLVQALRRWRVPLRYLALYAWNPLTLVAVSAVGHSEAGLVLGVGLLALGLARAVPGLAWVGLGLAGLSKGVPFLMAPLLFRFHASRRGLRRASLSAMAGLLPVFLLAIPFLFPGLPTRVLDSADLYIRLFEFNAGLFWLLRGALDPLLAGDPSAVIGPALRWIFLALAAVVWIRHRLSSGRDVLAGGLLLMGLYLATATTIHPWYVLWGLVLVPFVRRHRAAWLWAAWAGFPTYLVYTGASESLLAGLFWGGAASLVAAEEWHRVREPLLRLAGRRKARQVDAHLRGPTILDLGAGEGYVADALRQDPRRKVILADLSPSFRVPGPALVFDGRRLPLEDASVDTVLLSLVLHHADDPDALLAEALRVSKDRVVVTESTYRYRWERALLERLDRWVNQDRGSGPMGRAEDDLEFRRVDEWEERIRAADGRMVLSRRLNRLGHRHHLFVVRPARDAARSQRSPKLPNSSVRSPS
jgi:alpha-1,6-mannosyltransferase